MPIITISRGTMSGGTALADCLAESLGIPCVGREPTEEDAAAKIGVSAEVLSRKLQQSPGLWERLTADRRRFVVAAQAAVAEHAASGDLVYHGLAGQLLLRGAPAVLRVRLVAPLEMRARAVMDQHGLSRERAEEYIRHVDEDRSTWMRTIYGAEVNDPIHYDLILNLAQMSLETACTVVADTARRPEFVITDEARAALQDFVLACRVKLALAMDAATRMLDLEVTARDGEVMVRGRAPETPMLTHKSERFSQEVSEVAGAVDGVRHVELDLARFGLPLT